MITIHSILFSLLIISSLQDNVVELVGIEFKVVKKGHSDRKYIWLHGDEQTARMALESHMKLNLGTAFFIQGETREKDFFDGILDPNRIFSSKGAEANIHKYNRSWSSFRKQEALEWINRERDAFLESIFPKNGGLLVALHNNFKGYNVNQEIQKSDSVSIKKDQNPRDFFICTDRTDFEALARSPFNVVLQEKLPKKDDGSLSWAAMRNGVRYVNIEVRLGWLSQQKKMLNYLENNLE
jgi:hypothetical protein